MRFLQTIQPLPILDSGFSLLLAFLLGTLIGAERQYRQRSAGLRTTTLVAVGAAAFVDIAQRLTGDAEAVRVISYVVSGIGFLGAGVIMKEGLNVRGLNTAATLWCSAAVGAAAGSDLAVEALLIALFVLAGNTLLRPLADRINRAPVRPEHAESRIEVRITVDPAALPLARRTLLERLKAASYPAGDIEVEEHGEEALEVIAVLVSTAVVPAEIEAVVAELARQPGIAHASWEASTLE